jgi:DNA-binding response OmpR family regulator
MKPHVLVVDDSLTVRMDLRATLSAAGFLVTACDSRASARKALDSRAFSLVVLDVNLPDGTGIDILRELRAGNGPHIPVIMLTSEAEVKSRIRGLSTGADAYVGKPYDAAYVAATANELLRARDSAPPSSGMGCVGRKILVVDDSPTYLEKLAEVLRHDHHDVVLAASGEEALALLEVEPVHAIILDLLMPGIDGIETCRRIRRNPLRRNIPIMMLTGRQDSEARYEGLAAGVDEFVMKSPELELLKVRLRALLRKRRSEPDLRPTLAAAEDPGPLSSGMWHRSDEVPVGSLLHRVVMKSGLSSLIGPSTIVRACRRAGVDARSMTAEDLIRAMPAIKDTLVMFLSREEAEVRSEAIASLAREACAA